MKAQVRFKDGILLISSSRFLIWIITISGILVGITGIYALVNAIYPAHLLFSTGIIFTAMGLYSYLNSRYYKIYLNDEQGNINILESTFKSITSFSIPVQRYSMISIQTSYTTRGRRTIDKSYDVVLLNDFGSSLYLNGFKNRDDAVNFANKVKDCCKKELTIDNAPEIQHVKLKDVEKMHLREGLTTKTRMKEKQHGKEITLYWKNSFSYLHILYTTAMFYGLFHLNQFFLSSRQLPGPTTGYLNTFIVLFYIIALTYIIIKNSIRHVITITPDDINYYLHVLNKWVGFKEIKRDKHIMVKNSLNMNHNIMEILSSDTLDYMNTLKNDLNQKALKNEKHLVKRLRYALSKTIRMNTYSLTLGEKFYIEDMLLNK